MITLASKGPLVPCGITFHVGSQCIDEMSWVNAIRKSRLVWNAVEREGISLWMLNIGGGFAIKYTECIPPIDRIAAVIAETLREEFPTGVEIFVEPGRAIVGEAGILASTVIAKAKRNGQNWLYLDVGVFSGLMESIGGFRYSMTSDRDGPVRKWVVAGPSCDSFDVISNEVELPELQIGAKDRGIRSCRSRSTGGHRGSSLLGCSGSCIRVTSRGRNVGCLSRDWPNTVLDCRGGSYCNRDTRIASEGNTIGLALFFIAKCGERISRAALAANAQRLFSWVQVSVCRRQFY